MVVPSCNEFFLQPDSACSYYELVNEPYPERARELIDDILREVVQWRELLREEWQTQYVREEDHVRYVDDFLKENEKLKQMVCVATAAITVLFAIVLYTCSIWQVGLLICNFGISWEGV